MLGLELNYVIQSGPRRETQKPQDAYELHDNAENYRIRSSAMNSSK